MRAWAGTFQGRRVSRVVSPATLDRVHGAGRWSATPWSSAPERRRVLRVETAAPVIGTVVMDVYQCMTGDDALYSAISIRGLVDIESWYVAVGCDVSVRVEVRSSVPGIEAAAVAASADLVRRALGPE